ncbi:MAG: hypothetical protein QXO17_05270 [Nitrososphaerota archaeon]|nr:hypothetical protein [Candidatus Calditenuis fumarioli]
MRWTQVFGTVSSILLAAVIFFTLATSPPVYRYWGDALNRLVREDVGALGRDVSSLLWSGLAFPLIGIFVVVLALALGIGGLVVVISRR